MEFDMWAQSIFCISKPSQYLHVYKNYKKWTFSDGAGEKLSIFFKFETIKGKLRRLLSGDAIIIREISFSIQGKPMV